MLIIAMQNSLDPFLYFRSSFTTSGLQYQTSLEGGVMVTLHLSPNDICWCEILVLFCGGLWWHYTGNTFLLPLLMQHIVRNQLQFWPHSTIAFIHLFACPLTFYSVLEIFYRGSWSKNIADIIERFSSTWNQRPNNVLQLLWLSEYFLIQGASMLMNSLL